jgi:hypothetical protein
MNNYGCRQDDRPSVVRFQGAVRLCLTPEPGNKNLAIIGPAPDGEYGGMTTRDVTVDGVPAKRTEGRRADDGRYAGLLAIPSKKIYLSVRTTGDADRQQILDSARLVDVDHLGCAVPRPAALSAAHPPATFVPANPVSVHVCHYENGLAADEPLVASAALEPEQITALVRAMNAAKPGRNPDTPPATCRNEDPRDLLDTILRFTTTDGTVSQVGIWYTRCDGRRMENGARAAQLTQEILDLFMRPLHSGYGVVYPLDGVPS